MSEGENKFLKLAWNTSQEKPSTSQIVMKRVPKQGVIAGKGGRQAAHPGATCHGVGQQSPYGRISPSGKYTLSHPRSDAMPPLSCHRGVTVLRADLEEAGRKDSSLVNSVLPEGSLWALRAKKVF